MFKWRALPAYSNLKLHDPEARHEMFCIKYKRDLIKFLLNKHRSTLDQINSALIQLEPILDQIPDHALRHAIATKLTENEAKDRAVTSSRITNENKTNKKLYQLNMAYFLTKHLYIYIYIALTFLLRFRLLPNDFLTLYWTFSCIFPLLAK